MRSILPIKEAVQAAIYFAKYTESTISEYCWACHKIKHEITDVDREQVYPPLAPPPGFWLRKWSG
jgi:hypothetical protein